MKYLALLLLLPLAGCASQIGSLSGTSSISLTCGDTKVTYAAGLIPQMQPVTATCTGADGKVMSAGITPGIDIATIASLVKQSMLMHGEVLKAQ